MSVQHVYSLVLVLSSWLSRATGSYAGPVRPLSQPLRVATGLFFVTAVLVDDPIVIRARQTLGFAEGSWKITALELLEELRITQP